MQSKVAYVNSSKTENYLSYLVVILQIACLWEWYPETKSSFRKMINIGYFSFSLSIIIQNNISLFCQLLINWTTIVEATDTVINAAAYILAAFLMMYFRFFQKDLYDLIKHLETNFRFHSARGLSNISMMPSYRLAKILTVSYFVICLSVCCFWVISVLFSGESHQIPTKMWFPFDTRKSPYYQIAFILQTLGQVIMGCIYGAFCPLMASNCILICGQIDLLSCSIRNTRYTSALRSGMPYSMLEQADTTLAEDELCNYFSAHPEINDSYYHYDHKVVYQTVDARIISEDAADVIASSTRKYHPSDVYLPMYNDGAVEALKECIIFHNMILEYITKFKNVLRAIFLFKMLEIICVMCFFMYSLSVKIEFTIIFYFILCTFDTFIFCYFGNEVTVQADKVTLALNQSLWHYSGLPYRKMVTLMLLFNTEPVIISAGWFFNLTIETFLMVMKTSFSCYTMLSSVNQNEH